MGWNTNTAHAAADRSDTRGSARPVWPSLDESHAARKLTSSMPPTSAPTYQQTAIIKCPTKRRSSHSLPHGAFPSPQLTHRRSSHHSAEADAGYRAAADIADASVSLPFPVLQALLGK